MFRVKTGFAVTSPYLFTWSPWKPFLRVVEFSPVLPEETEAESGAKHDWQ
jgi:hypothetical protein